MTDYPGPIVVVNHVEAVPRRIRAVLGGTTVVDTIAARYVWEWPFYPQYYVPLADIVQGALHGDGRRRLDSRGEVEMATLRVGDLERRSAVTVVRESSLEGLADTARFEWTALDAWYEEDEQVFVHPRSPYVRVDALRSTRRVRVEHAGVCVAESSSPVMVFETGLPTRYYLNRGDVDFTHLIPSDTVSECPYKGRTSASWSIDVGGERGVDLAWSYDFPTSELLAVAGLVAFYNESVDTFVDGRPMERPQTHFKLGPRRSHGRPAAP
ncbi:MAG: DUF427 domain-containing protein [Actinomycetota bacterium]|nr:DUF427 domain-containing protein [Actinomycetota bacterium]